MNATDGFSFKGKAVSVAGFGKSGHDHSSAKPYMSAEFE